MVNFNFKLIAFNASNINEEKTLAAGRELAARFKSEAPLDVETFINDARVKAGWPVARRLLGNALKKNISKVEAMIAELVIPKIKTPEMIPEMIMVRAGKFMMGSTEYEDEQPVREITITKVFKAGKYPVTNEEYLEYLKDTGKDIPPLVADTTQARHPVVETTYAEKIAYCQWLSEKTRRKFRLLTEAEWEYMARGPEGRKYPNGNKFDTTKLNNNTSKTTPVDAYPKGVSWCGAVDMTGNVWEQVSDWYAGKYNPKEKTDPQEPKSGENRVIRGGSAWSYRQGDFRGASRNSTSPDGRGSHVGFRLAEDLEN